MCEDREQGGCVCPEGNIALADRHVIVQAGQTICVDHARRELLDIARIGDTPGTEVLLRLPRESVELRIAVVPANRQAGIVEVPHEPQVNLVNLVLDIGQIGPLNLRTEVARVQHAIAITAHGVVNRVGLDRRPAAIIDRVLKNDGRPERHESRRMPQRVVPTGLGLGAVCVQDHGRTIVELPFGVETEGIELVFRRPVCLLKADILGAVIVLLHEHGRCDRTVIVENDLIQRRGKPVGLLVAQLFRFVLGVGVVAGQRERVRRTELQHQLTIDPFTGQVREVIAAVLGHRVELACCRRVLDRCRSARTGVAAVDRAVGGLPHDPVIDLLGRRAGIPL